MKSKVYESPSMTSVKLQPLTMMMQVSQVDGGDTGIGGPVIGGGGGGRVNESKSVWDEEW